MEQLLFLENEDARAICNPCSTPLSTREEQVKAAIIAARQEALGLAKDGKTLLGLVLPRLLARHCKGTPGGRGGGGGNGHRKPFAAGADKATVTAAMRRTGKRTGGGKENAGFQNAGARAPVAACSCHGAEGCVQRLACG